ncbi:MAG TPA: 1-acyl-sn-glycerol-3-phosphate acyltransferase, partial [Planctomycetaceae bacterium]|nr:1-acyl-sn-glycerol-3-phosphate acyltransferase [Planctomycetaceae bacterium]
MRALLRSALWLLARLVIPLRYRIRVHGWEQVRVLKSPVLLLPNHPGYIDPVLILTVFYPKLRPRLMLYEETFRSPIVHPLVKLLNAVPVPDL